MKNKIGFLDFKLRLFLDTNVFIDYIQGCNKKQCVTFLNLFKKSKVRKKPKIADVELVTSDYVLWEFFGHCREELYVKWLINKYHYGLISANKQCITANFRDVKPIQMGKFGKEIEGYRKRIFDDDAIVYLYRLIGHENAGFSEIIDRILQCSKFSYKDAIVLNSAYFTYADMIVTCDEQFKEIRTEEGYLDNLKKALSDWKVKPEKLEYRQPKEFSSLAKIRSIYKNWFMARNKEKIIGEVVKYYPKINVIEIKCKRGCLVTEKNSIYIAKFIGGDAFNKFGFVVPDFKSGNFKSAGTKNAVKKGTHVTIKLPSSISYKKINWEKGMVFLSE